MSKASFIVQYGANWDGGQQECDAATRFVKEAAGASTSVKARKVQRVAVIVYKVENGEEKEVFSCPQRDLFAKYRHPAKGPMIEAIKACL